MRCLHGTSQMLNWVWFNDIISIWFRFRNIPAGTMIHGNTTYQQGISFGQRMRLSGPDTVPCWALVRRNWFKTYLLRFDRTTDSKGSHYYMPLQTHPQTQNQNDSWNLYILPHILPLRWCQMMTVASVQTEKKDVQQLNCQRGLHVRKSWSTSAMVSKLDKHLPNSRQWWNYKTDVVHIIEL